MAATFSYKINTVRTAQVGNLADVVKQVDFTLTGTEGEQSFSLPHQLKLADPQPENFVSFENLTEAQVISWVDSKTEIVQPMKDHIQIVLDRLVQEAQLQQKPLPWEPAAPIEPAPTPAP